jgi:pimeloyl-ACP methyl ester carboxylesterase
MHSAGYGSIALDLRGHGLSDKSRRRSLYKIPVMREDLSMVLKQEGITDFVLVGYSYGAYVALDYLRAYPGRAKGVVLVSTNYVSPFKYHWFSFLSPVAHYAIDLLGWLLIWQKRANYYYFDPECAQGYWKSTFTGYATMPLSINFWMLSEVFALDYRRGLTSETPALIIRGENDAFITAEETADLASRLGAKVVMLGLGHYVASHYQELVAGEILGFLSNLS